MYNCFKIQQVNAHRHDKKQYLIGWSDGFSWELFMYKQYMMLRSVDLSWEQFMQKITWCERVMFSAENCSCRKNTQCGGVMVWAENCSCTFPSHKNQVIKKMKIWSGLPKPIPRWLFMLMSVHQALHEVHITSKSIYSCAFFCSTLGVSCLLLH